jgi:geranylgeranyl diphosphate synthase type 3
MGTTKWDIYVNKEKYFVLFFLLKLCIILHSRIDDMQNHSALRRGVPAAHTIYVFPSTINAASYAYFVTMNKMGSLNHTKAMLLCPEQMMELFHGQGIDIYWRDNHTCPSVKEYVEMAKRSKDRFRTMSKIKMDL